MQSKDEPPLSDLLLPSSLPFKRVQLEEKYPRGSQVRGGRHWKHLKQILQPHNLHDLPPDEANYVTIEAPPSMYPAKKYCDITGLEAPYTDPHSKLRYANPAAFAIARSLPHPHAQAFLALRGAQTIPLSGSLGPSPCHSLAFPCCRYTAARCATARRGLAARAGGVATGGRGGGAGGVTLTDVTESGVGVMEGEGRRVGMGSAEKRAGNGSAVGMASDIPKVVWELEQETKELLEWPMVCRQVARFADTVMGYREAEEGRLAVGRTWEESQALLLQTEAALLLPRRLDFNGAVDVASTELAAIRAARRDNRRQLDESLQRAARRVVEGGGMDEAQPVEAIELNNNEAELSGQEAEEEKRVLREMAEQVADCAPLIRDLTDRIVALDLACARARHALWMGASRPVLLPPTHPLSHGHGDNFSGVNTPGDSDTGRNTLAGRESYKIESYVVEIRGIQHLVLLEMYLDALSAAQSRTGKSTGAADTSAVAATGGGRGGAEAAAASASPLPTPPVPIDLLMPAGVAVVVISGPNAGGKTAALKTLGIAALMAKAGLFLPLAGDVGGQRAGEDEAGAESGGKSGGGSGGGSGGTGEASRGKAQVAVVPWYDWVVADIGDEQSLEQSLSTFSAHMCRVSRILLASSPSSSPSSPPSPSSPSSLSSLSSPSSPSSPSPASSSSSSPFSSSTLVLLDEAGSGTDPSEGAALAAAILKHLAGCSGLTLATTHYADLKKLKVGREDKVLLSGFETSQSVRRLDMGCNGPTLSTTLYADHKKLKVGREGEWEEGRGGGKVGGRESCHYRQGAMGSFATTHYADLKKLRLHKGLPCSLLCLTGLLTPASSLHPPHPVPSFRQAADSRFENAIVAFDPVSLRPSFHILWVLPGTSHALSLAASRGLPPSLVARAARLARAASLEAGEDEEREERDEEERREGEEGRGLGERRQVGKSEADEYATLGAGRGEGEGVGILASLKQQWQRNVEDAREAAEARQQAERLLKDLQAHYTSSSTTQQGQQEQTLPVREVLWKRRYQRDVQEEVLAAREEISRVVAAFQETSLAGVPERAATDQACADVAAVAALTGLSPEANSAIGSDASVGGSAGDPGGADWVPALGEPVYVRRFGTNMCGTVVAVGGGSGEGSAETAAARSVTVQLGNLRLQVQRADLLPATDGSGDGRTDGEAGRRGPTGGLFGSQWEQDDDSNNSSSTNSTRGLKRGGQFPSPSSSSSTPLPAVREAAVQTARNTVDVRGRSAEDALAAVDLAVQSSPPGAVLVSRHEAESRLNIGCTIAYIG
ncbi:unnamed protein product [Closterium sp. Naga37s-1]|nr:unnamed protein product [Closterium sp. Naga37s-1]